MINLNFMWHGLQRDTSICFLYFKFGPNSEHFLILPISNPPMPSETFQVSRDRFVNFEATLHFFRGPPHSIPVTCLTRFIGGKTYTLKATPSIATITQQYGF